MPPTLSICRAPSCPASRNWSGPRGHDVPQHLAPLHADAFRRAMGRGGKELSDPASDALVRRECDGRVGPPGNLQIRAQPRTRRRCGADLSAAGQAAKTAVRAIPPATEVIAGDAEWLAIRRRIASRGSGSATAAGVPSRCYKSRVLEMTAEDCGVRQYLDQGDW